MNDFDADGLRTGPWQEDDPHGGIIVGSYVAGERQGEWLHHFADGKVRSTCHYDAGKLTGSCIWYRSGGGLLQRGGFLDDEKHGVWQRWNAAGELLDEGSFDRGRKTGEWLVYNADGTVRKRTMHRP